MSKIEELLEKRRYADYQCFLWLQDNLRHISNDALEEVNDLILNRVKANDELLNHILMEQQRENNN